MSVFESVWWRHECSVCESSRGAVVLSGDVRLSEVNEVEEGAAAPGGARGWTPATRQPRLPGRAKVAVQRQQLLNRRGLMPRKAIGLNCFLDPQLADQRDAARRRMNPPQERTSCSCMYPAFDLLPPSALYVRVKQEKRRNRLSTDLVQARERVQTQSARLTAEQGVQTQCMHQFWVRTSFPPPTARVAATKVKPINTSATSRLRWSGPLQPTRARTPPPFLSSHHLVSTPMLPRLLPRRLSTQARAACGGRGAATLAASVAAAGVGVRSLSSFQASQADNACQRRGSYSTRGNLLLSCSTPHDHQNHRHHFRQQLNLPNARSQWRR